MLLINVISIVRIFFLCQLPGIQKVLGTTSGQNYKRTEKLDGQDRFRVEWRVNQPLKTIIFELTVKTKGWVGFGISDGGGMTGADIVVGGVFSNGTAYFKDMHGIGNSIPLLDKEQNWYILSSYERLGITYLKFWRKLHTCDDQDVEIRAGGQRFIWAIGESDRIVYHVGDRGSYVVNILDPPPDPVDLSRFKRLDILMNITMPVKDTVYWCTVHRSPHFQAKQHAIAFGPAVRSPAAQKHSHHFQLFRCKAPKGKDPEEFFEPWIKAGGHNYLEVHDLLIIEYCEEFIYAWAMGGRTMYMPKEVGFPIGEQGREYFMMEVHLDNPGGLGGFFLETGVEIFYTEELRSTEAGIMSIGKQSGLNILIPPKSNTFKISAHCPANCLNFMDTPGVTVFNVELHSHASGRKMRLRHFRDGTELPWIADDQTYDNHFQNNRNVPPVKLLPRDHLTLECVYSNTWKNPPGVVLGGESTRQEMCTTIMYYYPRGQFSGCGSSNSFKRILRVLGIQKLAQSRNPDDPKIQLPNSLAGVRYLDFLENKVTWTKALSKALEEAQTTYPQSSLCMIEESILESKEARNAYQSNVTYPPLQSTYQPEKPQCPKFKGPNIFGKYPTNVRHTAEVNWAVVM